MGTRLRDDGFEEWFHAMRRPAWQVARRMTDSSEAAEDVVAEGFARALARWPKVRGLPHRDAWLLRTVTNLSIDLARRKAPRLLPPAPITVDDAAVLRVALAEALRQLPRRQREVIVLRYLADLDEQRVATALAISTGTVKTHAKRGLTALSARFGAPLDQVVPNAE